MTVGGSRPGPKQLPEQPWLAQLLDSALIARILAQGQRRRPPSHYPIWRRPVGNARLHAALSGGGHPRGVPDFRMEERAPNGSVCKTCAAATLLWRVIGVNGDGRDQRGDQFARLLVLRPPVLLVLL